MADLIDYYFKGVEFGTNFANQLIDKPMERAARQIALDGAQMGLEDDLILREARLNNMKAILDNQGHQNLQAMRFRQALEPYQFTADRSRLQADAAIANNQGGDATQQSRFRQALEPLAYQNAASQYGANIAGNQSAIQANQQGQHIADVTFPQRVEIAKNNVGAGVVNSGNALTEAQTSSIHVGANHAATMQNAKAIADSYSNNVKTGSNLTTAGLYNSEGQLQAAKDARTKEAVVRQAISTAGYKAEDIQKQLQIMAQDANLPQDIRIAAANAANEIQGGVPGLAAKVAQIETAPEVMAVQLGLSLAPTTDQYGNYQIYDNYGNLQPISRAGLQAMLARMSGVDPTPYQKLDETITTKRAGHTYGDSAIFGAIGGSAGKLGIGAPSQQTADYAVMETFRRLGWRYDNVGQQWVDSNGQVVPPDMVVSEKNKILTTIGAGQ